MKPSEREISIQNILETAMKLFAERGFDATTTDAIAKGAGVSKGLIYFYFDSKDDILKELITRIFDEVSGEIPPDLAPLQIIKCVVNEFKAALNNLTRWKVVTSVLFQTEKKEVVRSVLTEKYKQYQSMLCCQFEQLGSCDPDMEARELLAILDGVALHSMFAGDLVEPERILEFVVNRYEKIYQK